MVLDILHRKRGDSLRARYRFCLIFCTKAALVKNKKMN